MSDVCEQCEQSVCSCGAIQVKPAVVPHKCPICEGCGQVPGGYYERCAGVQQWTSSVASEPCRACGGSGFIYC